MNMKKYAFEFLSIFVAVVSAFALNNWNENRRDNLAEQNILQEIANGLEKDIEDIHLNMMGHKQGIAAVARWRSVVDGDSIPADSCAQFYFNLTRDFISIQNTSGYESLKSKGLELIEDDSLRFQIISLYEYDFEILRKFEEEYTEMQFHSSYYQQIHEVLTPHFKFDGNGQLIGVAAPIELPAATRSNFLGHLWKIDANRSFILRYYTIVEKKVTELKLAIDRELER